jgi:hypothetical protein
VHFSSPASQSCCSQSHHHSKSSGEDQQSSPPAFLIPPNPSFSCHFSKFRLFVSPYEVEYDINPFIHASYLSPSTPSREPNASPELTNKLEDIPTQAYPTRPSLAGLDEQAIGVQLDQISEELSDFRPQVDPTDHRLVSPPVTLRSEAEISATRTRQQSIGSEITLVTSIWTPPYNTGTPDTESSESIRTTRNVNPSVHQAIAEQPSRFAIPSVDDQHLHNGSIKCSRCGYCGIIFDRVCDRK